MAKVDNGIDEEPDGSKGTSAKNNSSSKRSSAYRKLGRDLSEDELSNSGTQKMLLGDLDRLEVEVQELKEFREKFYDVDKSNAVKDEQLKSSTSKEVLYAVVISIGAVLIGLTPSLWSATNSNGQLILGCGLVLVLGGIISKFFWK